MRNASPRIGQILDELCRNISAAAYWMHGMIDSKKRGISDRYLGAWARQGLRILLIKRVVVGERRRLHAGCFDDCDCRCVDKQDDK